MYICCGKKVPLLKGPKMSNETGVDQHGEQHSGKRPALSRFAVQKDRMIVFSLEKKRADAAWRTLAGKGSKKE